MVIAMYAVKVSVEQQSMVFAFDAQELQMMQMGKWNELSLLQNKLLMVDIQLHFAGIHPYNLYSVLSFRRSGSSWSESVKTIRPFIFAFSNVHLMVS